MYYLPRLPHVVSTTLPPGAVSKSSRFQRLPSRLVSGVDSQRPDEQPIIQNPAGVL